MSRTDELRAILARFALARDGMDSAAIAQLLTDDVVYLRVVSFEPEPVIGRDAVAASLTTGSSKYFDPTSLRREMTRITIENDVAAVEQRLTCRTRDGEPYANSYVWIYEFCDNQICRIIEHADTLLAARQMGMVP
jgi:ketosteroid isomerase-like protein